MFWRSETLGGAKKGTMQGTAQDSLICVRPEEDGDWCWKRQNDCGEDISKGKKQCIKPPESNQV